MLKIGVHFFNLILPNNKLFPSLKRIAHYIKTRIAYEDLNQLKRKFQAFLDKKIYIFSCSFNENKYDLDMEKFMKTYMFKMLSRIIFFTIYMVFQKKSAPSPNFLQRKIL